MADELPDWLIFAGGTVVGVLLVLMLKWILKEEDRYPYPYHFQQQQPVEHHYYHEQHHEIARPSTSKKSTKHEMSDEDGYYVHGEDGKMYRHRMDL